jgi:hypothetical protein
LPSISPFTFGNEEKNIDDAVSAVCTITKGDLPIDIWWTFIGDNEPDITKNLSTNDGIVISKSGNKLSLLNIESVKHRHRGNYTCWARNKAGSTHHTSALSING